MTQAENEKELILGNKQLISLFFLVVAMCGAFFAFGYMIGRNATKVVATTTTPGEPGAAAAGSQISTPAGEASPVGSAADSPATGNQTQPAVTETQPARDTPVEAAQTAPPAAVTASPAPAPPPVAAAPAAVDASATYLQVTALHRADADNLVKTLREQNLPALTAESSKPDLFRVLVGPYHQMTQVAEAKARLKALGFANAFVQK